MCPTPQIKAPTETACLLPGHLLGLLPCGHHLDHVPQKGHPTFFDQQGAVLVRCGERRGRQQGTNQGGSSLSLGPETHPCCDPGEPCFPSPGPLRGSQGRVLGNGSFLSWYTVTLSPLESISPTHGFFPEVSVKIQMPKPRPWDSESTDLGTCIHLCF